MVNASIWADACVASMDENCVCGHCSVGTVSCVKVSIVGAMVTMGGIELPPARYRAHSSPCHERNSSGDGSSGNSSGSRSDSSSGVGCSSDSYDS